MLGKRMLDGVATVDPLDKNARSLAVIHKRCKRTDKRAGLRAAQRLFVLQKGQYVALAAVDPRKQLALIENDQRTGAALRPWPTCMRWVIIGLPLARGPLHQRAVRVGRIGCGKNMRDGSDVHRVAARRARMCGVIFGVWRQCPVSLLSKSLVSARERELQST